MQEDIKDEIPYCDILGVHIAAISMPWLIDYLDRYVHELKGRYICVSNVHTTIMASDDLSYRDIQNNAVMALPDGGPLSTVGRRRGYLDMKRITGPDLMGEIFSISSKKFRHFFYGSTENTLYKLRENLLKQYPEIEIAGMYSPPFRPVSQEEDKETIAMINSTEPDFIWVGLGAPKQEQWMAQHQGKVNGLMIGVGAGFDFFAGNLKRAPIWMRKLNLEWLFRLSQEPRRLYKRYWYTNTRFLWRVMIRGK